MRSFAASLLSNGGPLAIVNRRTGQVVVSDVQTAFDSRSRKRGLLGRAGLPESAGLVLAPCNAVHTFFMKFAIDVVYLDRAGVVRHVVAGLRPWRFSACLRSHAVLETAAGVIQRTGTTPGDQLFVTAVPHAARTGA